MATATRALAFVSRWFDAATVSNVFEPLIADWQREWCGASGIRQRAATVRWLTAFICAALISSPRTLRQSTPLPVAKRIVTRIAVSALPVAVLMSLPYAASAVYPWPALLFVMPSSLAIAFPFAMIGAVDAIRRDHALPPYVERATVVKLAIASVVFMVMLGGFVTPAANQAFRAAVYKQSLLASGVPASRVARLEGRRDIPPRGLRELTTYELMTDHGRTGGARYLAEYVSRELNGRAALAVLPVFLLWLRWRMLESRAGRWSPPAGVVAVFAAVGYYLLRQWTGHAPMTGAWSPFIVFTLLMYLASRCRTRTVMA